MKYNEIRKMAREIIQDAMNNSDWYQVDSFDSDTPYQSQFIGTVFNIMPSGKFYTPWANSNVDDCNRCHGSGFGKLVTCQLCDGSGMRIKESWMNFPEYTDGTSFPCNGCNGSGKVHESCKHCNGIGSREAYEDELMNDQLEFYASKYGAWIESGEGDPCDLFLCKPIDG